MSETPDLRGRILKVERPETGYSQVVLDNGVSNTITVVCLAEQLGDLLSTDSRQIWEHLVTRKPGHFRSKRTLK